jgi:hypothetical protein
MPTVGGAVDDTAFEEEPFAGVCGTVAESLASDDMVGEWQERGGGHLSFEDQTHTEAIAENSKVTPLLYFDTFPRCLAICISHPHFILSSRWQSGTVIDCVNMRRDYQTRP